MKNIKIFLTLIFCLLSMESMAQEKKDISLLVLRKSNKKPMSAYVVFNNQQKLADEKGMVTFNQVNLGLQKVTIYYLGYEFVDDIDVKSDQKKYILAIDFDAFKISEIKVFSSNKKSPIAYKKIDKKEITRLNLAKDVPYLLKRLPNSVVNSDAGNGVGYTSMRIRGIDAKGINVNINGVPYNDAEGQGVFWVNIPDIANSSSGIQVQRGLGTGVNGAGAFGANIFINTLDRDAKPWIELNSSFGSFNTRKNSAKFSTGLLRDHWKLKGSLSNIHSDGFLDRAVSDLNSYYLSLDYLNKKSSVSLVHFAGKEVTYQAWNGTPESKVNENEDALTIHYENNKFGSYSRHKDSVNLFSSGRSYNYYQYNNQVDNYGQNHFQLHYKRNLPLLMNLKTTLYYTKGKGYYEQLRISDNTSIYGFDSVINNGNTFTQTNAIRRLWLDNDLYGANVSLFKRSNHTKLLLTTSYQIYKGSHFGRVLWSDNLTLPYKKEFYFSEATKSDGNVLGRIQHSFWKKFQLMAELQIRRIYYAGKGNDNKLNVHEFDVNYVFVNPKLGLTHLNRSENNMLKKYVYVGVGNREPNRTDIVDNARGTSPLSEQLIDVEGGVNYSKKNMMFESNIYFMNYKNQLIPTGKLNDVGAPIRENTPQSYRVGLELGAQYALKSFQFSANVSLSQNKIKDYTDLVLDYGTNDYISSAFTNTNIAFSPNIVANVGIEFHKRNWIVALMPKYVGKQYLDNTQSEDKSLAGYFISDFQLIKSLKGKSFKNVSLNLSIYNILNHSYSSNGYTYSYIYGNKITENFLYPQAGRHFLIGLNIKI